MLIPGRAEVSKEFIFQHGPCGQISNAGKVLSAGGPKMHTGHCIDTSVRLQSAVCGLQSARAGRLDELNDQRT